MELCQYWLHLKDAGTYCVGLEMMHFVHDKQEFIWGRDYLRINRVYRIRTMAKFI